MDEAANVSISLEAEGAFFSRESRCWAPFSFAARACLVRLVLRLQWRVRGSGEAASDAYEIEVLEPLRDSPSTRDLYPFELPSGFDYMVEAHCGWYADAVFEGRANDQQHFEVTANIVVLPTNKGAEGAYR